MTMWRCFHCDEAFTDRAAACEHFGESRVGVPLCQEPRDVQEALRRTRIAENESLRMADSLGQERTENERLAHLLASWERQFGTTDPRAAWNRLDSMEGRALAAEARVAELEGLLRDAHGHLYDYCDENGQAGFRTIATAVAELLTKIEAAMRLSGNKTEVLK